jgi:hypothetical protein
VSTYVTDYTGTQIDEGLRKSLTRRVGSLYVSANETPTAIAQTQTYYRFTGPATTLHNQDFTTAGARLTLVAPVSGLFLVMANMCLSLPSSNIQIRARIGLNGDALPRSCAQFSMAGTPGSGLREAVSLHTLMELTEGDYMDLMVGNWTNTDSITVRNLQFTAIEL